MSRLAADSAATRPVAPRYQPLILILGAACLGILVDRRAGGSLGGWWSIAAAGLVCWSVVWRRGWRRTSSFVLLLAVAAAAAAWHHCRWCLYLDNDLGRFVTAAPQAVCADVVAIEGPVRLPADDFDPMRIIPAGDRSRLEVEIVRLRDGQQWRTASGRATLTVDGHLLGVHAGDRLRVFAQLAIPRSPQNPGEPDRAAYARRSRVRGLLRSAYPDCVTLIGRSDAGGPRRWLETVRSCGNRLLWQHIDPRRAPLASALLLGIREELGDDRRDIFLETGTIHLLCISGLHVGIIAWAVFEALRWTTLSRPVIAAMVVAATFAYAWVTGAGPPAVRAAVLVLLMCMGYGLGRRRLAFNSLAAAALVVLAINPAEMFSIGAQLSFLSVAGLMWFAPNWSQEQVSPDPLDRLVEQSRSWPVRIGSRTLRFIGQLFLVSATAWLLTLPLVAARFHVVATVALILNIVVWLPVTIGLVSGFLVLAFGWLLPPVAAVCGWCCDACLWLTETPIAWANRLPKSHLWIPGPADWWLVGLYGGLGVLAAVPKLRPSRRGLITMIAGWTAVGLAVSLAEKTPQCLHCSFLSVGHGCAVLIRLPSGQNLLYDAGQLASPEFGAQSIAGALWSQGARQIDAIVLSHADADHYNAVPELLKMFRVGVVYVSPRMFADVDDDSAVVSLRRAIDTAGVPVREIYAGQRMEGGEDCCVEVIHPTHQGTPGSDNANSIVLAVEYGGRRILLPGDLESPGLEELMRKESWDSDVLLVPHHGSRRSDPSGLSGWYKPEWVVISGSRSREWDEAATAYTDGGAKILHTAYCGSVDVRVESGSLRVTTFHPATH
ncbi:MAG: ComEC/Rec2 family competence protein [Rhodopirellula sp.]|nr:ComEC/Rec2 family competence protein [Rhodopirellula sp.]